jgi:hypothetical protein
MQFQLPSNLQSELLAYDPKLKQLQRDKTPKDTKAKPKFPLGAVFDLIPADVVDPETVEQVVTYINTRPVQYRYRQLTRVVDADTATARTITNVMHIIGTPFFRKWIQSQCDEAIAMLNNPDNNLFRKVVQPWNRIERLGESIAYVHSIWPDCPVDFYQTHVEYLIGTRLDRYVGEKAKAWLQTHMKPASFFQILKKNYEDKCNGIDSLSVHISKVTGRLTFYITDWNDTLSMLDDVINNGINLDPPRRWRLTEFHDHVQVEAWKIKHPNVSLPQDLFPSPIKVEVGDERWTFFQPHDTHQLSAWGEAVRNCVGNASGYAEGVRKKKHFIVLCMVDGKPKFTVQLTVEMGMMSVSQIVGTSNQSLTQEQKDSYTEAFGKALKLQADALESV